MLVKCWSIMHISYSAPPPHQLCHHTHQPGRELTYAVQTCASQGCQEVHEIGQIRYLTVVQTSEGGHYAKVLSTLEHHHLIILIVFR